MVFQDHRASVAQRLRHHRAGLLTERHAIVFIEENAIVIEPRGALRHMRQVLPDRRQGGNMFGMGVRDAVNVRACLIYLRVNVERLVYRDIAGEGIQFEIRLVDVIGRYLANP